MRPLEILSLSVLAATLVVITLTWLKRPAWLRFLPTFPAIAMAFQVLVEGYRWQMVPGYVLSLIVFLAGLPTMIRGQRSTGKSRSRVLVIIGSLLGLALVWITVELCVQVPSFVMPVPGGPYDVGTLTFLLVDESRIDDESPIGNGYRTLSIQIWYPADLTGREERTTYLNKDIRQAMERLGGLPAWYSGYQDRIRTYAHWDARVTQTSDPFPVIVYSPSGNASLHKILFEELASQGYVVLSISHPHWSNVLFDDQGEVIPVGVIGQRYQTWFREDATSAVQEAKVQILSGTTIGVLEQAQIALNEAKPVAISELRQWSEDIGFVLDQLAETKSIGNFFGGQIDLSRVGVMGFSLGGATAGQFCVADARCQAGINVDGFMFGDILDKNLSVPFMFIHSENPEVKPSLVGALFYERAEDSAYVVQVSGASHGDLGAPKPTGRSIIIQLVFDNGQFPDGAYLAQIMNDYVLAFFDKHLKSEAAPLLDGTSPYPEVLFMKKDGD